MCLTPIQHLGNFWQSVHTTTIIIRAYSERSGMYRFVLDLHTTEEHFGTVRRHLDSALFGTQKRTTPVVRFLSDFFKKKNEPNRETLICVNFLKHLRIKHRMWLCCTIWISDMHAHEYMCVNLNTRRSNRHGQSLTRLSMCTCHTMPQRCLGLWRLLKTFLITYILDNCTNIEIRQ